MNDKAKRKKNILFGLNNPSLSSILVETYFLMEFFNKNLVFFKKLCIILAKIWIRTQKIKVLLW